MLEKIDAENGFMDKQVAILIGSFLGGLAKTDINSVVGPFFPELKHG